MAAPAQRTNILSRPRAGPGPPPAPEPPAAPAGTPAPVSGGRLPNQLPAIPSGFRAPGGREASPPDASPGGSEAFDGPRADAARARASLPGGARQRALAAAASPDAEEYRYARPARRLSTAAERGGRWRRRPAQPGEQSEGLPEEPHAGSLEYRARPAAGEGLRPEASTGDLLRHTDLSVRGAHPPTSPPASSPGPGPASESGEGLDVPRARASAGSLYCHSPGLRQASVSLPYLRGRASDSQGRGAFLDDEGSEGAIPIAAEALGPRSAGEGAGDPLGAADFARLGLDRDADRPSNASPAGRAAPDGDLDCGCHGPGVSLVSEATETPDGATDPFGPDSGALPPNLDAIAAFGPALARPEPERDSSRGSGMATACVSSSGSRAMSAHGPRAEAQPTGRPAAEAAAPAQDTPEASDSVVSSDAFSSVPNAARGALSGRLGGLQGGFHGPLSVYFGATRAAPLHVGGGPPGGVSAEPLDPEKVGAADHPAAQRVAYAGPYAAPREGARESAHDAAPSAPCAAPDGTVLSISRPVARHAARDASRRSLSAAAPPEARRGRPPLDRGHVRRCIQRSDLERLVDQKHVISSTVKIIPCPGTQDSIIEFQVDPRYLFAREEHSLSTVYSTGESRRASSARSRAGSSAESHGSLAGFPGRGELGGDLCSALGQMLPFSVRSVRAANDGEVVLAGGYILSKAVAADVLQGSLSIADDLLLSRRVSYRSLEESGRHSGLGSIHGLAGLAGHAGPAGQAGQADPGRDYEPTSDLDAYFRGNSTLSVSVPGQLEMETPRVGLLDRLNRICRISPPEGTPVQQGEG